VKENMWFESNEVEICDACWKLLSEGTWNANWLVVQDEVLSEGFDFFTDINGEYDRVVPVFECCKICEGNGIPSVPSCKDCEEEFADQMELDFATDGVCELCVEIAKQEWSDEEWSDAFGMEMPLDHYGE
jgi:hypothetical protein